MTNDIRNPVFMVQFTIPPEAMDENGHVNNVNYVQWMQDIAVRHYTFLGGIPLAQAVGATWVVRSHHIEYLSPAFAGDMIEARTWVTNIRRVRSLRRYEFVRIADDRLLARGETDWVFVHVASNRPIAVPPEIVNIFPFLPDGSNATRPRQKSSP
jgi:acyl-CoA thioester hydrolase